MTKKVSYVTKEGLKKLQDELDNLQNVERPKISKAIGEAIEKGDISENAEYDAAKDAQGLLEAKIAQLQDIVSNCRIIDESQIDTSKVQILNKVTIKNIKPKATNRDAVSKLLDQMEMISPHARSNLFAAMQNIREDYLP